jgi:putative ABC transport system substrate-binding protein
MGGSNDPLGQGRAAALVQGLGEFNWHDGGNLRIDWRWAGGNPALYESYAAELIALDPEVLVVWGSPGVGALRRQTSTIPIVLVNVTDPVGKWLRMLTQIIPPVARVAVLFNPTTAPFAGPMLRVIEESAPSLAVAVRAAPCHDDAETEAMMSGLAREERAGLLVLPENFVIVHRHAIITLRRPLPAARGLSLSLLHHERWADVVRIDRTSFSGARLLMSIAS